jgi:hypothetical protein
MSYLEDFKTLLTTFSLGLSNEERHKLDQQDTWEHLLSPVTPYEPKRIKLSLNGKTSYGKLIRSIAIKSDISFNHIKLTKTIPTLEKLRTIYINISRTESITNLSDIIYQHMDYAF